MRCSLPVTEADGLKARAAEMLMPVQGHDPASGH
jgi:hypothetical protein